MIQSLFLLSPTGQVLIERHFRAVITERAVCDTYWLSVVEKTHHNPILEVPSQHQGTLYVISIRRDGLSYLAVCPAEVSPLTVLELLHRLAGTFQDYFGNADEAAIKDNFSTVYQLLEEMVDYGHPLTTELNALKAMIRPPTIMSKLLAGQGVSADSLPMGTVSNMPWRTAGINHSNNEIYVDILEEVDAVVDLKGRIVSADVQGSIQCQSHLSGIPDLLLTFNDARLIDDCSFHPCVRYTRFENEGIVSFVPPDGNFELMRYRIEAEKVHNLVPPVYCNAQWSYDDESSQTGRLQLQVGVTPSSSLIFSASARKSGSNSASVEDFCVRIPFPKGTKSTKDFNVTMGKLSYDEGNKVARWNVSTDMDSSNKATLTCKFTMLSPSRTTRASSGSAANSISARRALICSRRRRQSNSSWLASPPNLTLGWKIPLASVSGISVNGLSVTGETYRPYKGVRNVTKAGLFSVRCSST